MTTATKQSKYIGMRFGRLIVIERTRRDGAAYRFLCRCDCGNEVEVRQSSLSGGSTRSCGCLRIVDLTGQRFGRLLVTALAGKKVYPKSTVLIYRCQCDCGNETEVFASSLRSKLTTSCGCLRHEKKPRVDLTGRRFGRLLVEGYGAYRKKFHCWSCRCDCGRLCVVRVTNLNNGHTESCGCLGKERRRVACTKHGLSRTKEYVAAKAKQRLERKRGLDVEWTPEMEVSLVELQGECILCAAPATDTDHVNPLSRGYGLRPGNAVRLCGSCNSRKHAKLLSDLPHHTRTKLTKAAQDFEQHWNTRI